MRKKRTPEAATLLKIEYFTTLFIAGERHKQPFLLLFAYQSVWAATVAAAVHVAVAAAAAVSVDNYQQQIVRKMPPGHYGR